MECRQRVYLIWLVFYDFKQYAENPKCQRINVSFMFHAQIYTALCHHYGFVNTTRVGTMRAIVFSSVLFSTPLSTVLNLRLSFFLSFDNKSELN